MPVKHKQKRCKSCDKLVLAVTERPSHLLHFFSFTGPVVSGSARPLRVAAPPRGSGTALR